MTMYKFVICVLFLMTILANLKAATIRGNVKDETTGEMLVGASIYIQELKHGTISGLDGSYVIKNIPIGNYTLLCKYVSYQTIERKISVGDNDSQIIEFGLSQMFNELSQVNIVAHKDLSSDMSARQSERTSFNLLNVESARSIELSPDQNVANVVQRMPGVTLDKTSSGVGQYALLRGMDKRYSYTLINGIKIPSTNSKHRYVPLDIFPSDLVDRVEVSKVLTPDMEGDAISGAVNLVMKNAPDRFMVKANVYTGFSQYFSSNDYLYFDTKPIHTNSPYEENPKDYLATPTDFPKGNLDVKHNTNIPLNMGGGLTIGDRFFNHKLGLIFSGSYQNSYKGTNSTLFGSDISLDGNNLPLLSSYRERTFSNNTTNYGLHSKIDFQFNPNHRIQLYTAYMDFENQQVRETDNTDLLVSYDPENGSMTRTHSSRLEYNIQDLFNTTLQGDHKFGKHFSVNWSAVYSEAKNQTPNQTTISYNTNLKDSARYNWYIDPKVGSQRLWRHNSDTDKAGYLNLKYAADISGVKAEFSAGALYREKTRTSFYNNYTINPYYPEKIKIKYNAAGKIISRIDTSAYAGYGYDWVKYSDVKWDKVVNPAGTVATSENFDAQESMKAAYGMFLLNFTKLQMKGGLRVEQTRQGYSMLYPIGEAHPHQDTTYTDFLPSLILRYALANNQNLHLSYYRATNKPGFLEIVPCPIVGDDYTSRGNFELKEAVADNLDLRWEYFSKGVDQIMAGIFYKNIKDAIEYSFIGTQGNSHEINFTPINVPEAINYGIEIDFIKFYREFGVKGNYTYTSSNITTDKLAHLKGVISHDSVATLSEVRPLYGQSAHVGNISLIYKSVKRGLNAQLAFSYTGDRIYSVSEYYNNDQWQKGFWQMDASAEKSFRGGWGIFFKAHNLLNPHVLVYIKGNNPANSEFPEHSATDTNTAIRDDYSQPSYLLGIRYKFN
jgi:TonB-dependent receptor